MIPISKKLLTLILAALLGVIGAQFSDYNLASITPNKGTIVGAIIKVYDGDTITLQAQGKKHKIRLYGLDAPEIAQSFGVKARDYLLQLCPLHSKALVTIKNTDKYGRIVGIVSCNNTNVNAKLVKDGYAWAYLQLCPLHSKALVTIKNTDKYGRIVGIVSCNNTNVNAKLVKDGYAWAYQDYTQAYLPLELYARVKNLGLWSEKNPIKPSDYRKQKSGF